MRNIKLLKSGIVYIVLALAPIKQAMATVIFDMVGTCRNVEVITSFGAAPTEACPYFLGIGADETLQVEMGFRDDADFAGGFFTGEDIEYVHSNSTVAPLPDTADRITTFSKSGWFNTSASGFDFYERQTEIIQYFDDTAIWRNLVTTTISGSSISIKQEFASYTQPLYSITLLAEDIITDLVISRRASVPVPSPATFVLLMTGLGLLIGARCLRNRT